MTARAEAPRPPAGANAPSREITLRFLAEPSDVNFGGKVHGGAVMRWIDQAGFACAAGWSGHYCVTVYVSGIRFLRPIMIGHLVEAVPGSSAPATHACTLRSRCGPAIQRKAA